MTISGSAPGTPGSTESTTDTAREQAGRVGGTATEAGRDVAGTAREQAGTVAQEARQQAGAVAEEAKQQARDLVGEARSQARQQATSQRDRLAQSLRSVGDELDTMAQRSDGDGIATELARQASRRTRELAAYLDRREPGDLVEELRNLARRRPGTFLVSAAVAGLVVGRVTRSAASAAKGQAAVGPGRPTAAGTTVGGYPNVDYPTDDQYAAGATYPVEAPDTSVPPTTVPPVPKPTSRPTVPPTPRSGPQTLADEPLAQRGEPSFSSEQGPYESQRQNPGGTLP